MWKPLIFDNRDVEFGEKGGYLEIDAGSPQRAMFVLIKVQE